MDDWTTLLNYPKPRKHNLTSQQIMDVQLQDFLLVDDKKDEGKKDAAPDIPSAASSIHQASSRRNKRNDQDKNGNSVPKFWFPNTKGWLSAGFLLLWVSVIIWVSGSWLTVSDHLLQY